MKELLRIRKKIKGKKPVFIRQDAHKKPEIGWKWRRPKGIHSKMRLKKRGYRRSVEVGWGTNRKIKHLDKSGLKIKLVHSMKDLDNVYQKTEGIIIGKKVGLKKRVLLLKKADEKKIRVLNIKDVAKYLKDIEEKINKRKEMRKKVKKEKEKKKEKEAKKEKEKGIEKVVGDEEKKKSEISGKLETSKKSPTEEKKEKDKVLTKKV